MPCLKQTAFSNHLSPSDILMTTTCKEKTCIGTAVERITDFKFVAHGFQVARDISCGHSKVAADGARPGKMLRLKPCAAV